MFLGHFPMVANVVLLVNTAVPGTKKTVVCRRLDRENQQEKHYFLPIETPLVLQNLRRQYGGPFGILL